MSEQLKHDLYKRQLQFMLLKMLYSKTKVFHDFDILHYPKLPSLKNNHGLNEMELTIPMTIEEDNVIQLLCRGHEKVTFNVVPPEVFEVCFMYPFSKVSYFNIFKASYCFCICGKANSKVF